MRPGVVASLAVVVTIALTIALQALVGPPPANEPQPERCRSCHQAAGIEAPHASLRCSQCHLGAPGATQLPAAHAGLVRVPGNFSDMERTCGAAGCHADVPLRLRHNIMNTMNGVVSVDRWVFGEQPTPTAVTPLSSLGASPADLHQRNLCASCHLGHEKREPGPITERTRGGGCTACHLERAGQPDAGVHARLRALPHELACFGCHARSGRISLNIEGWNETPCREPSQIERQLADGRCLTRAPADVHTGAGLRCVDCHGSWEVMGDGRDALHAEDQSTVSCEDCHTATPSSAQVERLDAESKRLVKRAGDVLRHRKSGKPMTATSLDDAGAWLTPKYGGERRALRPPAKACQAPAHQALACATCHTSWAPQCVTCHTSFDPAGEMYDLLDDRPRPGAWNEVGDPARAEPPSLGVRERDGGREVITFVPGMVMTLDGGFHRLFAPLSPHTIRKEPRSCASCHLDPLALGYGRGTLTPDGGGWSFTPDAGPAADGLPQDAWIPFLGTRDRRSTTRDDTRPFTRVEQERVLRVGACLSCHRPESPEMRRALESFDAVFSPRGRPRCPDAMKQHR